MEHREWGAIREEDEHRRWKRLKRQKNHRSVSGSEEEDGRGRGPGYEGMRHVEKEVPKISRMNRQRERGSQRRKMSELGKSAPARTIRDTRNGAQREKVGPRKETGISQHREHKRRKVDRELGSGREVRKHGHAHSKE